MHFVAYPEVNIIKTYTEITNAEKKPVKLAKYASSLLHLDGKKYYLTESGAMATGTMNRIACQEKPSFWKCGRAIHEASFTGVKSTP